MRIKDVEEIQDLCTNIIKVGEVVRFADVAGSYGDVNENAIELADKTFKRYLVELSRKLDSVPTSEKERGMVRMYFSECDVCGRNINIGDEFYNLGGEHIHEECIDEYLDIAEKE